MQHTRVSLAKLLEQTTDISHAEQPVGPAQAAAQGSTHLRVETRHISPKKTKQVAPCFHSQPACLLVSVWPRFVFLLVLVWPGMDEKMPRSWSFISETNKPFKTLSAPILIKAGCSYTIHTNKLRELCGAECRGPLPQGRTSMDGFCRGLARSTH